MISRENWTLTVILLAALGLGITISIAPVHIQNYAYLAVGVIFLPLAAIRAFLEFLILFRENNKIAGLLWIVFSFLICLLALAALSQFLNSFQP